MSEQMCLGRSCREEVELVREDIDAHYSSFSSTPAEVGNLKAIWDQGGGVDGGPHRAD